ncbi:putative Ig domain-containing protein [Rathayibacter oskolensis]|nr:putative Ig domain-containing protein [Rathayibacter oskolensis]WKK71412.1 putative Ig domain-containing protein [Rathayibacter oskolensis]
MVGSAYDCTYTVTGTPTPTVSVVSGALPPGLTLSTAGRLTGTPTIAGTYTFTARAENSAGTAQATSTLTVSPQRATTPKADLRVDLSGPGSAVKGRTATYTVVTTNAGPAASTSVYSKVILPSTVQFVSATGKYTRIGNIVVFQRSSLSNGQTVTEKITVKATSTGRGTALATTFSVKTPDPSIRSNSDTVSTTVR